MNKPDRPAVFLILSLVTVFALGCGGEPAVVDAAPFREAIAGYLRDNNMALAIKAIKAGPIVDGDTAQLTASLTHQELGGPSVTWSFHFRRQQDGRWTVVRHDD